MLKSAKTPKKAINGNKSKSKSKNKTTRSKTATNFFNKEKKIKENELAIEDTGKYYQKYYEAPNSLFTSQLKTTSIKIFLNSYKLNDILVMSRIFSKYKYFKSLILAPTDPSKKNSKVKVRRNPREPITEGEKLKISRQNKDAEVERINMINRITVGIGRHLAITKELRELTIDSFDIDRKFSQNISYGMMKNSSLETLNVNNCKMPIDAYEILLKGLLNHVKIGTLNLKNNELGDKYGNMIGRIIARQTYRRDQIIWILSIRNEFPENNDYAIGLISLDLSGNELSSYSADCLTTALASDQYVRSINLSHNKFDKESCKKFIYMLRKNMTLLNIDLRSNPGYDDNVKKRLVMKMSKNIRYLSLQYKKKVYTEKEYKNLKKYINPSFFNDNIPKEIVQFYNDNLQSNILNSFLNINTESSKDKSNSKSKNKNNKGKNGMLNNKKEYSYSTVSKNSPAHLNPSSNKKKQNNIKNVIKNGSGNVSPKDSDKLLQENLLLKRIILELKAENIQKVYGKKLIVPKNYNANNLNKNYQKANKLFDDLEEIMYTIGSDKKEDGAKNNNKINDKKVNEKKMNDIKSNDKKLNDIKLNENKLNNIKLKEKKLNEKKEEKKIDINNIVNKSKPKEEKKVKEKENMINNKNNKINNNIDLEINDIEDEKEVMKKKSKGQKFNILDIYDDNDEEDEKENDDVILDNPEHQQIYENLKKNYESRGLKFGKKEFMEILLKAQQEKLEGGEGDDDDDDDEPF